MLTLDTKPSSLAATELLDYISSQTNTINIRTRRAKMAAPRSESAYRNPFPAPARYKTPGKNS